MSTGVFNHKVTKKNRRTIKQKKGINPKDKNTKVDEDIHQKLMEMGFRTNLALEAAQSNSTLDSAITWILDNILQIPSDEEYDEDINVIDKDSSEDESPHNSPKYNLTNEDYKELYLKEIQKKLKMEKKFSSIKERFAKELNDKHNNRDNFQQKVKENLLAYQKQIQDLENQKLQMEKDLKSQIEIILKDKFALSEKLEKLLNNETSNQENTLKKENSILHNEIRLLKSENTLLRTEHFQQIDTIKKEKSRLESSLNNSKKKLKMMELKLSETRDLNKSIKNSQNTEMNSDNLLYQEQSTDEKLVKDENFLEKKLRSISEENKSLHENFQQLTKTVKYYQNVISQCEKHRETTIELLAEGCNKQEELQKNYELVLSEKNNLEIIHEDLRKKLMSIENNMEDKNKLEELQKNYELILSEKINLEKKSTDLHTKLSSVEKIMEDQNKNIALLKKENSELRIINSRRNEELEISKKELINFQSKFAQSQKSEETLFMKLNELEVKAKFTYMEIESLKKKCKTIEEELGKQISSLKKNLSSVQISLDNAKRTIEDYIKKESMLKLVNHRLEQEKMELICFLMRVQQFGFNRMLNNTIPGYHTSNYPTVQPQTSLPTYPAQQQYPGILQLASATQYHGNQPEPWNTRDKQQLPAQIGSNSQDVVVEELDCTEHRLAIEDRGENSSENESGRKRNLDDVTESPTTTKRIRLGYDMENKDGKENTK